MHRRILSLCFFFLLPSCVPITQGMTDEDASRVSVEIICARMSRCGDGRYDFEKCLQGDYWPTPAPLMGIPNGMDRCLRFVMELPCTKAELDPENATVEDEQSSAIYQTCFQEL